MTTREQYAPGPATGAEVRKDGDKWTLILVREMRHSPQKVWLALTDPAQLREWAPFDADGNLAASGSTVKLTTVGAPTFPPSMISCAKKPPTGLGWVSSTFWRQP